MWGRVGHTGPGEFSVVVTGMTEAQGEAPQVFVDRALSREAALALRDKPMKRMGEQVRSAGGTVVDVLEDG